MEPSIKTAASDLQDKAQDGDGIVNLLHVDKGEPYRLCMAKKVAAFFKISRFILGTATSRRRCRSPCFSE